MEDVLLLDMDNTVLRCNEAYFEARARLAAFLARLFPGLPPATVETRFNEIHAATLRRGNVDRSAYPSDMAETYRRFATERGHSVRESEEAEAYSIGESVYAFSYAPYPGALEMLTRYREAGFRLGLCTKGVEAVQEPKIDRWGLRELFHDITIVTTKSAEVLRAQAARLAPTGVRQAWMVGDSLRDDIESGLAAGMTTALVQVQKGSLYDDGCTVRPHHQIPVVTELPRVLALPVPTPRPSIRARRR